MDSDGAATGRVAERRRQAEGSGVVGAQSGVRQAVGVRYGERRVKRHVLVGGGRQ